MTLKSFLFFGFICTSFGSSNAQQIVDRYLNGNKKIIGQYDDRGKKVGRWFELDSLNQDTIRILTYANGQPNGPFKYVHIGTNLNSKYQTSQLYNYSDPQKEKFTITGTLKNNLFDGPVVKYYVTGNVHYKANYRSGLKEGIYKEFHDNGHLRYLKTYSQGKLHGNWQQF